MSEKQDMSDKQNDKQNNNQQLSDAKLSTIAPIAESSSLVKAQEDRTLLQNLHVLFLCKGAMALKYKDTKE
jgi:hypothetical protein